MESSPLASEPQQRRKPKMAATSAPLPSTSTLTSSSSSSSSSSFRRGSPYLPTARETLLLSIFPVLLLFGTLFRLLSPQTRGAAVATAPSTAHYDQTPGLAPSYFARKDNVLNVFFVKRGWFWITVTFGAFVGTHPFFANAASEATTARRTSLLGRRGAAVLRWGLVTGWWFLVTQWFFGPALIDRNYRLTGGGCQAVVQAAAAAAVEEGDMGKETKDVSRLLLAATASACKHAGGQWRGGHDISGHVFLLVLGTTFLAQEIGWVLWRRAAAAGVSSLSSQGRGRVADARSLVMPDGAVKSAEVEAELSTGTVSSSAEAEAASPASRLALRFAAVVVGLSLWMLLMTAIYFHTWFEKLTGLLVALTGFYSVYVLPRWVPGLRRVVGLPGL
ncbi:MAG: hypothetical protein STHCBS139747_004944 [Sporothrix thermara]